MPSNPDNTLRNETFRMVLIQELWDSGLIGIPPNASEEQAIANILLAIKNRLPKERNYLGVEEGEDTATKPHWIKAIPLADVKQALDIESES